MFSSRNQKRRDNTKMFADEYAPDSERRNMIDDDRRTVERLFFFFFFFLTRYFSTWLTYNVQRE
jgi:hypothetical protein